MNRKNMIFKRIISLVICLLMVVTVIPTVPSHGATVDGLKLTVSYSEGDVLCQWTWPKDVFSCNVYRAKDVSGEPGNYIKIGDRYYADSDERDCEDWLDPVGKRYYYKVVGYDENGVKVRESNVVVVNAALCAPWMGSVVHDAKTGVPVIDLPVMEKTKRIDVYRSKSAKGTYSKIGSGDPGAKFMDKNAASGTTYYYKLKAIHKTDNAFNSSLSGYKSAKKVKAEPKLAEAIKASVNSNGFLVNITTLDETLKLTSTANINSLIGYDGGPWLEGRKNDVPLSQIYNLSKISAAGGTLVNCAGLGDPYFSQQEYIVKKNGISYNTITGKTYGINILKVSKDSTQTEIKTLIKETAKKYYPNSKWTIYTGKYSPDTVKYDSQVKSYKTYHDKYTKKSGYGNYVSNKYYLSIKNKSNSSKKGWTFITVVPTLNRLSKPVIKIKNLDGSPDMKVSWGKISGANKYEVWKKVGSNGTYKKVKTTTKLYYKDTTTVKGKKYYYKVKAIKSGNSTQNSKFSGAKYLTCK